MNIFSTVGATPRTKITMRLYLFSVILVIFSLIVSLALGASEMWLYVVGACCLLAIFPFFGIDLAKKGTTATVTGFTERQTGYNTVERTYTSGPTDARGLGVAFGILMVIFTVAPVAFSYDIYPPDIPGGVLIFISGILALTGAFFYDRKGQISANYSGFQTAATVTREKEIIHEKEVIVKVRCAYCQNTFDETLDKCPTCGAKK